MIQVIPFHRDLCSGHSTGSGCRERSRTDASTAFKFRVFVYPSSWTLRLWCKLSGCGV